MLLHCFSKRKLKVNQRLNKQKCIKIGKEMTLEDVALSEQVKNSIILLAVKTSWVDLN